MRRWDRFVGLYIDQYRARGIGVATVAHTVARLERWGRWLEQSRPRVSIEQIDAELITRYLASCSSLRAKANERYTTLCVPAQDQRPRLQAVSSKLPGMYSFRC